MFLAIISRQGTCGMDVFFFTIHGYWPTITTTRIETPEVYLLHTPTWPYSRSRKLMFCGLMKNPQCFKCTCSIYIYTFICLVVSFQSFRPLAMNIMATVHILKQLLLFNSYPHQHWLVHQLSWTLRWLSMSRAYIKWNLLHMLPCWNTICQLLFVDCFDKLLTFAGDTDIDWRKCIDDSAPNSATSSLRGCIEADTI